MRNSIKCSIFLSGVALLGWPWLALDAAAWPASSDGTDIGLALAGKTPTFEPSGMVWHEGRATLMIVGDEGQVAELRDDGTLLQYWDLGGGYDLEDVTLADPYGSTIFLADENTSSALEFDLNTGALTGRTWSFASMISELAGFGLEGLTFVPDGVHGYGVTASGGLFYAGWQHDGDIYIFEPDLAVHGAITFIEELHMTSGYTDLSALNYDFRTQTVYALYDDLNILEERTAAGELLNSYADVPGTDQEGFALGPDELAKAKVYVAEDTASVMAYADYPLNVVVPPELEAVAGIEFVDDFVDNDGDAVIDEVNVLTENGLHPVYGTYDPTLMPAFGTVITELTGVSDGKVDVRYVDGSVYEYAVFDYLDVRKTVVLTYKDSGFVLATLGKQAAIVNGFTGEVIATRVKPKTQAKLLDWAQTVLGF